MAIITGPLLRFSIPNDFQVKHAGPWAGRLVLNLPNQKPPVHSSRIVGRGCRSDRAESWIVGQTLVSDLSHTWSTCFRSPNRGSWAVDRGPWAVDRLGSPLIRARLFAGSRIADREDFPAQRVSLHSGKGAGFTQTIP